MATRLIRPMRLKIEINTREHFAILGFKHRQLVVENPWFTGKTEVMTYELDELLGTKLRALYQRRKGRDLFDLWLCLNRELVDANRVVKCFLAYMEREGAAISRAEFERTIHEKQKKPSFLADLIPLLADRDRPVALGFGLPVFAVDGLRPHANHPLFQVDVLMREPQSSRSRSTHWG